jgi:4-hydroxybutyryl-CoA dehydratase/vinylacetyl-CoA-Delta-isomerase
MQGHPNIPASQRMQTMRLIDDLTASNQAGWYSVMSIHGGGSPEAMKREIWRNYPVTEKKEIVQQLMDRDMLARSDGKSPDKQPGRCCPVGCRVPSFLLNNDAQKEVSE